MSNIFKSSVTLSMSLALILSGCGEVVAQAALTMVMEVPQLLRQYLYQQTQ